MKDTIPLNNFTFSNNRSIASDQPCFIIAEAACNHMCDMKLALRMVDEAAAAGADSIKFQTYKAEKLVTDSAVAFWGTEEITQMEYYKRLDRLGKSDYKELFEYALENGIIGFSSPFDIESAEMLNDLGMEIFKIASCEIPNISFIRHVARYNKPIMLSTGASTTDEIERAIDTILTEGNNKLMLMACTLSYPTSYEDANFKRITTLIKRYPGYIVGISDHTEPTEEMTAAAVSTALGAKLIEKHYTLDRTMTGSGHFFAVDPGNLKQLVQMVRFTETLLGSGNLGVEPSEQKALHSARRSIVAETPIKKGQVISLEMLGFKRPGDGLGAHLVDSVVGKKIKQDVNHDQRITLDMLE